MTTEKQTSSAIAEPWSPHEQFLGLSLFTGTTDEFLDQLIAAATRQDTAHDAQHTAPQLVSYVNAHCVNVLYNNAEYAATLRRMRCVYADGMAVVWGARRRGCAVAERVNAGDFLPEFCTRAAARGVRVALVGGRPGVAERCAVAMRTVSPSLEIVATEHGFFATDDSPAQRVAAAQPDIVLVGMGVPQQEAWAAHAGPALGAKVVWCVGALFEYYGEGRARAPVWMRRAGLEWVVRLVLEPRRMWRRYLVGNVAFVFRVLRGRPIP